MLTIIDFQTNVPDADTERVIKFINSSSQSIEDAVQDAVRDIAIYGDAPVHFVSLAKLETRSSSVTRYHVLEKKDAAAWGSTLDVVSLEDLPSEWSAQGWETFCKLEDLYLNRCVHTYGPYFARLYLAATDPAVYLPKFGVVNGKFTNSGHLRFGSEYLLRAEIAARKNEYLAELSKFACERRLVTLLCWLERKVVDLDIDLEVAAKIAVWLRGEFLDHGLDPLQRVFA